MRRDPVDDFARSLGITPEGLSKVELGNAIEREISRRSSFRAYRNLLEQVRSLGVEVSYIKLSLLKDLLLKELAAKLKERGIVKGAIIHIPKSAPLTKHGEAQVTNDALRYVISAPVIQLRFLSARRSFGFNALYVLKYAEITT